MRPAVERIWILAPVRGSAQNYAATHNLKVAGSNPAPATKLRRQVKGLAALPFLRLYAALGFWKHCGSKNVRRRK